MLTVLMLSISYLLALGGLLFVKIVPVDTVFFLVVYPLIFLARFTLPVHQHLRAVISADIVVFLSPPVVMICRVAFAERLRCCLVLQKVVPMSVYLIIAHRRDLGSVFARYRVFVCCHCHILLRAPLSWRAKRCVIYCYLTTTTASLLGSSALILSHSS